MTGGETEHRDADARKEEEFVRLLTSSYRSICLYVQTLLPNTADAEECVQEVALQLWLTFHKFDRAYSFSNWARGYVRKVVKNYYRRSRPHYLSLDDALIDRLMLIQGGARELLELRREWLSECLQRLSPADRKLIELYYEQRESVAKTAEKTNRTPAAVYQSLRRTRLALFGCVDRHLKMEK